jgi:hypothetical protein
MRLASLLLLAALAARAQEAQKPAEQKRPDKPRPGEIMIPDPGTKIEDSAVARKEVARFRAEYKAIGKGASERAGRIARLGDWDHPVVLAELKKYLNDRSYRVSVAAAVACARQTDTNLAGKALLGALRREKRPQVVCAMLVGMGRLEFKHKAAYKEAVKWFKRDTTETHKAAARYLGYIKAKEAFRILADRLEAPRPARVDDPKNPPASYWRARWEEFQSNAPYIRWALGQLVPGESFETRKEAEDWARTEGAKHGIKW